MSPLTDAQLQALRTLRTAYPDAEIAIIGATALALRVRRRHEDSRCGDGTGAVLYDRPTR